MKTVNLRGTEYTLGKFSSLQLLPYAFFITKINTSSSFSEEIINELRVVCDRSPLLKSQADVILSSVLDRTIPKSLWNEVAEILTDLIVPGISRDLVDPSISRGIFLEIDEHLELYLTCTEQLKEKDIFKNLEVDTESAKKQLQEYKQQGLSLNKDAQIEQLKKQLESLQQGE